MNLSKIYFVHIRNPRESGYYMAYNDYFRLVHISGFQECDLEDVKPHSDNTYIFTLNYDGLDQGPIPDEYFPQNRTARYIHHQIERYNIIDERFDEIWLSDRSMPELNHPKAKYMIMGGDRNFMQPLQHLSKEYDFYHMCYTAGRRGPMIANLAGRGFSIAAAPVDWTYKNLYMQQSRIGLALHQHPDSLEMIEPLRYTVYRPVMGVTSILDTSETFLDGSTTEIKTPASGCGINLKSRRYNKSGIQGQYRKAALVVLLSLLFRGNITGDNPKNLCQACIGSFFPVLVFAGTCRWSSLDMNKCIPEGVPMRDFLLSLIDMFRLYVEQDRDNPDNYIIEPRDNYFLSSAVDWSDKLDYEKGLEMTPMAELQGRRYAFRYKEDKDYWNTDYQNKYKLDGKSRTYGDFVFDVNNDFVTNEVAIQPIFSPTPSYGSDYHTRVIPVTYGGDGSSLKQIATNIRILYWGGLKSATHWYLFSRTVSSSTLQEEYPYSGHVDDPFNATLDLSFDCPKEVQWTTQRRSELTDATLYMSTTPELFRKLPIRGRDWCQATSGLSLPIFSSYHLESYSILRRSFTG